MIILICIY